VLLFAVTGVGYLGRNLAHMRVGYTPGVVGPAQLAAMRALPKFVPAGQIVLNDPIDGSPWMYAVAGAHPMFVHYAVGTLTADQTLLLRSLNLLDTDHAVQSAVRRLGIHYVFVGDRAIYPWTSRSPGFLFLVICLCFRLSLLVRPLACLPSAWSPTVGFVVTFLMTVMALDFLLRVRASLMFLPGVIGVKGCIVVLFTGLIL